MLSADQIPMTGTATSDGSQPAEPPNPAETMPDLRARRLADDTAVALQPGESHTLVNLWAT